MSGTTARGSRGTLARDPGQALRDVQQVPPIVPHGREGASTRISSAQAPPRANPARSMALSGLIRVHCAGDGELRGARREFALPGRTRHAGAGGARSGPRPAIRGRPGRHSRVGSRADVAIVGGGFTGLWTAIQLADADPRCVSWSSSRRRSGSGRAGGTAGSARPASRMAARTASCTSPTRSTSSSDGHRQPRRARARSCEAEGIDCDLERTGAIDVATEPWQADEFEHEAWDLPRRLADAHVTRPRPRSRRRSTRRASWPAFEEGPEHSVMLDPAKLAWGLADGRGASRRSDRRGHARPPARPPCRRGATSHRRRRHRRRRTRASWPRPRTRAGCAAWSPLFVPVYDYVLVTEPLTAGSARRRSAGRAARAVRRGYQFHYFRLTADDRILWGGYDADLSPGQRGQARVRPPPGDVRHARGALPRDLPAARGHRASPYRWGGAIDTSTRFCVTFGETMGGRVAVRARLHRAGRGGGALGGRRRARLAAAARLGAAQAPVRADRARSRSRRNPPARPRSR